MIENHTFRLAAGVDATTFREADARVQQEVAYLRPGLVRRTTACSADGEWLVSTIWQSAAHADDGSPILDSLLELIDASTVRTARYDELD